MPRRENTAHRGWPLAVHCSRRHVGLHEWFTKRAMPPFLLASRYLEKHHRQSALRVRVRVTTSGNRAGWCGLVTLPKNVSPSTIDRCHLQGRCSRMDKLNTTRAQENEASTRPLAQSSFLFRIANKQHREPETPRPCEPHVLSPSCIM